MNCFRVYRKLITWSSDAKSLLPSGIWWHTSTCVPHPRRRKDDRMFVVKVYCKIFHQDRTAVLNVTTNILSSRLTGPWVFQGEKNLTNLVPRSHSVNLVPRSHSVLHLAVGDLGTRLKLDSIFFTNWITSVLTFKMTKLPHDKNVKKC